LVVVIVVVVKMDAWAVGTFLDKKLGSARLSMMSRLWTQPTTTHCLNNLVVKRREEKRRRSSRKGKKF
jgi:hypothetical protein